MLVCDAKRPNIRSPHPRLALSPPEQSRLTFRTLLNMFALVIVMAFPWDSVMCPSYVCSQLCVFLPLLCSVVGIEGRKCVLSCFVCWQVFQCIAKDVMLRLKEQQEGGGAPSSGAQGGVRVNPGARKPAAKQTSSCC